MNPDHQDEMDTRGAVYGEEESKGSVERLLLGDSTVATKELGGENFVKK